MIRIENLRKRFGNNDVLKGVNLHVRPKEAVCILGPSGIMSPENAEEKALTLLERVGLKEKAAAYPHSLSGGQKQRVAIARALCMSPKAMLFDEPTSALDPEMVKEVLNVIRELADNGMTMMIVTHEMNFAREVADRIVFMDGGNVIEDAPPAEFFNAPKTQRAKEFLGKIF